MSTEIATITDSNKDLIRRNYCPSATPDEFEMFRAICNRYGLDPFCREAWFVKYGGSQAQIFVGRDGMLAIANRSGQFDGIETSPNFDEKGNLVSATCTVWRKDMSHPFTKTVYLKEYTTGKSLWQSKPITMLQKVAEAQALRAAFTISGLYCQEEMGIDEPVRIEHHPTDIKVEPVQTVIKEEVKRPVPSPAPASTYTADMVNTSIIPNYQSHGFNMGVFSKAQLDDGTYDKDMIDADYKSQLASVKTSDPAPKQSKPEPEVHTESGLDEFKAEIIQDATENHKRMIEQPYCVDCGNRRVFPQEESDSRKRYGVPLCSDCMTKRISADLKLKEEGRKALDNLVEASKQASASAPSSSEKQTKPTKTDDGVCSVCGKKMSKVDIASFVLMNPNKPLVCNECVRNHKEN